MGSIAEQKYNLAKLIFAIDNPVLLDWLEKELSKWQYELPNAALAENHGTIKAKLLRKSPREKFDAEVIKREQNWQGQHNKEEMMRLIKEMNIQEPVELLLSQLSK